MRRRETDEVTMVIPIATLAETVQVAAPRTRSRELHPFEVLRAYLRSEGLVLARAADTSWCLDDDREVQALREMVDALGA
jgi:hypothetical protein